MENRSALEEIKSRLAMVAIFNMEELKPQAAQRAKVNKKNKLSSLEAKLKSYKR